MRGGGRWVRAACCRKSVLKLIEKSQNNIRGEKVGNLGKKEPAGLATETSR